MAVNRIKGITIEINGDVTKLDQSLKSVNKSLKETSKGLTDTNRLLKLDPSNTELLKQKQEYLAQAISSTKEKIEQEKQALEQMKNTEGFDTSSESAKALERQIIADEEALKALEKEAKNLPTPFQASMKEIGDKVTSAGEKVKSVGDSITGVGKAIMPVSVAVGAVGVMGVKSFAEVDKTMQLTNKTMGNTAEEAELLNQAMKDAASNSTFGMADAATAMLNFARAGLDAEQAANALAPAMNLAAGEGGNLDTVSAGLVATINGFHGSFEDAEHYADVFAAACNNSALDVDSLSSAMSVATPVFSAAGYAVEDAALYMGVMANSGIEANKAANSLKTGMARLVSPAGDGAEMLDKLGFSITDADENMKDSVTVQKELHDAFADLSESEQIAAASAIFGKNQMAPWLALINTAPEDVDALNGSLADCSGTTEEMANAMMSGFGGSLEKLKSSIDVLVTTIGETLAPIIKKVVDFVQELTDKLNAMSPQQRETIVKIGLVVAAAGPLLVMLGTLISTIGSIMTGVGGLIGLLGAPLAGPIIAIVALVAGAIAIGVLLYKNWDKIKDTAKKLVAAVKQAWENFKKNTAEAFENAKTAAVTKAKDLKDGAVQKFKDLKDGAVQKVKDLKDGIIQKFHDAKDAVIEKVKDLKDGAIQKFTDLKDGAAKTVQDLKDAAAQKVQDTKDAVVQKFEDMKNGAVQKFTDIKDGALGVFEDIKTGISDKIEAAKETVSSVVETIKDLFSFDWKIPELKMPHFSWTWTNLGNWISIPNITIDWYKKAMDDPRIMKGAQIFGRDANGNLMAGGEAGEEVVSGKNTLLALIQKAVAAVMQKMQRVLQAPGTEGIGAAIQSMAQMAQRVGDSIRNYQYGDVNITVYGAEGQDVRELARIVKEDIKSEIQREEAVFA